MYPLPHLVHFTILADPRERRPVDDMMDVLVYYIKNERSNNEKGIYPLMPVRAFIAIDVPASRLKGVDEVLKALSSIPGVKCVETNNIHITIRFLGDIPEGQFPAIESSISEAIKGIPDFIIKVSGVGAFPSERDVRVIWIKAESGELEEVAKKINTAIDSLGFKPDKPFTPHITLARLKMMQFENACRKVIQTYKTMEFGSFNAGGIKLKKSTLTSAGPVYEDLKIWNLSS
jgi:2'-5' RNA ligase